jgi:DNA-binding transcriptional LysR family regulator
LTAYLQALRAAAPNLILDLWETNCEELADALIGGEIDVAIMSSPDYGERLRAVPLYREPYSVAFAPGHRFELMEAVPMRELDGEPYIKRLHCEFPSNFAKLGVARPYSGVQVRYMTEREDWVQMMVASGLGCTLMPKFLPMTDEVLMRPLIEPGVTVRRGLAPVTRRVGSAAGVFIATGSIKQPPGVAGESGTRGGRIACPWDRRSIHPVFADPGEKAPRHGRSLNGFSLLTTAPDLGNNHDC